MVSHAKETTTLEQPDGEPLQLFLRTFFPQRTRQLVLIVGLIAALGIVADIVLNDRYLSSSLGISAQLGLTITCVVVIVTFLTRERENLTLKRRLLLWAEIVDLSNPRFGVDLTLTRFLEKLRTFYDADDCVLIDATADKSTYHVQRPASDWSHPNQVTEECALGLLVVPENEAFVFRRSKFPFFRKRYFGFDVVDKRRLPKIDDGLQCLLDEYSHSAVISVPVLNGKTGSGRLFLTSSRKRAFSAADLEFLNQLVDQIFPLIENIRVVDTLAASVGERERERVALDIHDSVIQRFIGIQLGVEAIRQKIEAGDSDIASDLNRLERMTHFEVSILRHYTQQLSDASRPETDFLTAVRRLSSDFSSATGIAVTVKSAEQLKLNERLATEAFQMIAEGLSNIHHHTKASEAVIEIVSSSRRLNLKIGNNGRNSDGANGKFRPKSITSRAALLGGAVEVELAPQGRTWLSIGIPM